MNYIKITETGKYIPKTEINNEQIEQKLNLEKGYIEKRTGIKTRYYAKSESIEEMAIKATKDLLSKSPNAKNDIGLIIVATTSSKNLMPGISNLVQKKLDLKPCICLDILAGCSGYINAFEIAKMYIQTKKIEKALIIGVDKLSEFTNQEDISTAIILSDGAGASLIEKTKEEKKYFSNIEADAKNSEILTCKSDEKIKMQGKEIYKYAVTKTVENINKLLKDSNENIDNIKYIIPHQSNMKIIKAISTRLKIEKSKLYTNIENVGNTFCASIPIVLDEMKQKGLLQEKDKVILLGYGGGLNTGSILIEL